MEIVQESPIIQELREEWLAKGRQEGRAEGRQEGRQEGRAEGRQEGIELGERKATIKALHQTLTIRFSVELGKFDEQFERLDVETLQKLNGMALTVQSLKEFESVLVEILSKLEETWLPSDDKQQDEKGSTL